MRGLSTLASALTLLLAAATAAAAPAGLDVRLSAPSQVLRGDVNVSVTLTVTNVTRAPLQVLRWELPGARHENAAFEVLRDGQPVAYTGALVKRAAPTAADYVRIEPGQTLSYTVELTEGYDLSANGTYSIEYASKGTRDGSALRSDKVFVQLESRSGRGAVNAAPAPGSNAVSIGYTGCSTERQALIVSAVDAATTYANQAVSYFSTRKLASQRFTKWFGPGTRSSWFTVKANFSAIQDAFVTRPLEFDCTCNDAGVFAYVFPTQPYKIYLCPVFWQVGMTGTDSKAGTLIHEMSHFNVVAGTRDFAYGQAAAAALAISNPANAIRNADSHEYFAENTPVLP